jgi:ribose/xylose/arabinose/galactoside ABC-type transport system permease subunit
LTSISQKSVGTANRRGSTSTSAFQEVGLVLVVICLGAALSGYGYYDATPGRPNTFLNADNLIDGIATPMSYYAIMAIGMTVVVVAGGIDISVGSTMALSGMLTAWTLQRTLPADASAAVVLPLATALALSVGLACGLVNGLMVASLRMHPFIVTLGTLSVYRCLATAPFPVKTIQSVAAVRDVFGVELAGVRVAPLAVMLLVVAFGWVYLHLSVWGRETYAVGGNEEAARFSGIDVGRAKVRVYAISGLLAGLAGLVSLGRFGTMSSSSASGYELTVVAAAVVGGASLAGGRGTAIGALLGTLILAMIENGINIVHLNQEWKLGIVGLSIIVAVAFDRISGQWRAWRRRGGNRAAPESSNGHVPVEESQ